MAKSKKELDKDVMYAKLMPSGPPASTESGEQSSLLPFASESEEQKVELLHAQLFGNPNAFQDANTPQLVNLMEDLIVERLDEAFTKFKCCRCDRCRKDVVAVALNKLQCHYAVGTPEQLKEKAAQIPAKDISVALVQAILQVRSNPRH